MSDCLVPKRNASAALAPAILLMLLAAVLPLAPSVDGAECTGFDRQRCENPTGPGDCALCCLGGESCCVCCAYHYPGGIECMYCKAYC